MNSGIRLEFSRIDAELAWSKFLREPTQDNLQRVEEAAEAFRAAREADEYLREQESTR